MLMCSAAKTFRESLLRNTYHEKATNDDYGHNSEPRKSGGS